MNHDKVHDQPSHVAAEDGEVVVDGFQGHLDDIEAALVVRRIWHAVIDATLADVSL